MPHLLVGGKRFHEREEVETLRAALAAIEWPDDELSVFATLRGAFFAIGDEALLEYRRAARHGSIRSSRSSRTDAAERSLRRVGDALDAAARRCTRGATTGPVADTIARAARGDARARRLRAAAGGRAGARQRAARRRAGAPVRGGRRRCRSAASSSGCATRPTETRAAEAPILEEGSDGVRLMTVHKAKGLEFPVVILADIGADLSRSTASRWVDTRGPPLRGEPRPAGRRPSCASTRPLEVARDEAEGVRVAYVAATRARDLLVVCAVGDLPCPAAGSSR